MLIHFTRNPTARTRASVTITGTTITPSTEAKYLGIIFNQKLKFHSHLKYIIDKRTKYALTITRIAKSKWGPEYKYIRRLSQQLQHHE